MEEEERLVDRIRDTRIGSPLREKGEDAEEEGEEEGEHMFEDVDRALMAIHVDPPALPAAYAAMYHRQLQSRRLPLCFSQSMHYHSHCFPPQLVDLPPVALRNKDQRPNEEQEASSSSSSSSSLLLSKQVKRKRAEDDVGGGDERFIPFEQNELSLTSLDDRSWLTEPVSEKDDFCFLCTYGKEKGKAGFLFGLLEEMYDRFGSCSEKELCMQIKHFYDTQFRKNIGKDWTLRAVLWHAEKHRGVSYAIQRRKLRNTLYDMAMLLSKNGLVWQNKKGEQFLDMDSTASMIRIAATFNKFPPE